MKNLFLFVVATFVLFVVGCQENAITDPLSTDSPGVQAVTNETTDKNQLQDFTDHPNVIKFREKLGSPTTILANHEFEVAGTIMFEHNVEYLNPPGPLYRVTVNLLINAELKETWLGGSARWKITEETEDVIYLPGNHSVILVKYFKIKGRSDGMALASRFGIDKDGVALLELWLTSPDGQSNDIVSH